ncbi:hypothetical protein RRG08_050603 [Elysia crispata]|uniref:TNFR-Cys domain-containing protein n=1 Tax=Elysia crispata TaxID=231223 RepID=A0AAE1AQ33_9GAST|nr:hypothetical protein RRG08_050603 [Elysia crispata]
MKAVTFLLAPLLLMVSGKAQDSDTFKPRDLNKHPMFIACLNMVVDQDFCAVCPADSVVHCSQRMLDHCHCVTFCYACSWAGNCPSGMCGDNFCSVTRDDLCTPFV